MRAGELQGFPFFSFGNFLYLHSYEPFFRSLHLTFHLFSFPLLLLLLLPLFFFFFFLFFCNFHSTSFKVPCEAPPLPPPLQISLGEINSKKLDDIIVLEFLYCFTVNFYILNFSFSLARCIVCACHAIWPQAHTQNLRLHVSTRNSS